MTSIYQDWGFRGNPFDVHPLPATETGSFLLVGRDAEVRSVMVRIKNPPKVVTLEGLNGLGKTSVINVATYWCLREFLERKSDQLLLPCNRVFQLHPGADLSAFQTRVLFEVAQTLISHESTLSEHRPRADMAARINGFLNSPGGASLGVEVKGVGLSRKKETTETTGFLDSGFRRAVVEWLEVLFPGSSGGVVCSIDNLELLKNSTAARDALEALRDDLLNLPGLRWVLCGTPGVVLGMASSPRMEGWLHHPVSIPSLGMNKAKDVLRSRIETYAMTSGAYLPLTDLDFERLYKALNSNLRSAISKADNYCMSIADRPKATWPLIGREKRAMFDAWLRKTCEEALKAARRGLAEEALEVFDALVGAGGEVGVGQHRRLGVATPEELERWAQALVAAQVVQLSDEGDDAGQRLRVTAQGWLMYRGLLAERGFDPYTDL